MTKKHMELIALEFAAVKDTCRSQEEEAVRDYLARRMARVCEEANPRFDRAKFLKACDVS